MAEDADVKKRRIVEDDDDEELTGGGAASRAVAAPASSGGAQEEFSPELLRLYYDRIFPATLFCRWMSYGTQHEENAANLLLPRREWSFTTGDDIYIRYLSYEDATALRKDLVSKLPHKIDIGAVFNANPRDHKKFKVFEPVQREFIIDIDLTDYDFLDVDVKRLETCDRCWPLMALALRVLTTLLKEDFGFEQLLWVYSGRRGIHCWACDKRARVMSNEVRSAVADYLGPKLNAATGRLQIAIPMHPSLSAAYTAELLPFFKSDILTSEHEGGFGILDTAAGQEKLLDMLQDEPVKERFLEEWARRDDSGEVRWNRLKEHCEKKSAKLAATLVEIVFTYTYPRLDVNVSKGMNHLLKSPWCVHPKTGRVCVPVDPETARDFKPALTPTLRMCAEDLDAARKAQPAGADKKPDISTTRLHQYEAAFDHFLKQGEAAIRGEKAVAKTGRPASIDF